MNQNLSNIDFDPELLLGAYNALNVCLRLQPEERLTLIVCLRLQPEERLTLITDQDTLEIAAALIHEIEKIGSDYQVFILEDFMSRPLTHMPLQILDDLKQSQVSIFAALSRTGELKSRIALTAPVNRYKIRHGHMVDINKQIMRDMREGMCADFKQIDELSLKILQKARKARFVRAKSRSGTDIKAEFSPELKWIKTSGIISPDKWGNLPGGEVFTSPYNIEGVFVVDGVVGDYLCKEYGDLEKTPLTIEIADSRIKNLACANKKLLDEFTAYTSQDENSDRVGEFAIGTNTGVKNIIGHILQDEKLPGIHIAFGNPNYPEFISPSAIPMPSIRDNLGNQRPTSTVWVEILISGWTTNKSCKTGNSCSPERIYPSFSIAHEFQKKFFFVASMSYMPCFFQLKWPWRLPPLSIRPTTSSK
jgi:leucyl aminopeptidase (aminopeptidase T)